jgi:plasmid stabilization system protein ParE
VDEAASWYEARVAGLGSRLLAEVERALQTVAMSPGAFPRVADTAPELGLRRVLVPRFPFGLVFLPIRNEIRIVAVAHTRRRPHYWLHRIVDEPS